MESLRLTMEEIVQILNQYQWLINSFVLDFYVDEHWDRLPASWSVCLSSATSLQMENLLDTNCSTTFLWPLSLLCIKRLLQKLCLERSYNRSHQVDETSSMNLRKNKLFIKNVKLKKRHEISQFSDACFQCAESTGTHRIVDFGSGLGHLARALAYGYGLQVCCIEQQEELCNKANFINTEFEKSAKNVEGHLHPPTPFQLNVKLTNATEPEEFVKILKTAFGIKDDEKFDFGIVGLHPCGDLTPMLLNLFSQCEAAKFVNVVGCCYMKLTSGGFPLSNHLTNLKFDLSHEAMAISCHSIESSIVKLKTNDMEDLKVHCYRATIEGIITKHWPDLRHAGLRNTKVKDISFEEYCHKAVEGLNLEIPAEDICSHVTRTRVENWKNVSTFYTLRLMFAPLIESVILCDRNLYLLEHGFATRIGVVFDPLLSPRNQMLTAFKN